MSKTPRRLSIFWIRVLFLVGLLGLPILAGCDEGFPEESGEGPGHRPQHLGLLPDQELAIGQQAYRQVLSENRGRILPADEGSAFYAERVFRAGTKRIATRCCRAAAMRRSMARECPS